MRHFLTGCRVVVDDDIGTLAAQGPALGGIDLLGHQDHVGEDLVRGALHVRIGLAGYDQAVALHDGVDVENDEADVVFIDAR